MLRSWVHAVLALSAIELRMAARSRGFWLMLAVASIVSLGGVVLSVLEFETNRRFDSVGPTAAVMGALWGVGGTRRRNRRDDGLRLESTTLGDFGQWAGSWLARCVGAVAIMALCMLLALAIYSHRGADLVAPFLTCFLTVLWAHALAPWAGRATAALVAIGLWALGEGFLLAPIRELLPVPASRAPTTLDLACAVLLVGALAAIARAGVARGT